MDFVSYAHLNVKDTGNSCVQEALVEAADCQNIAVFWLIKRSELEFIIYTGD